MECGRNKLKKIIKNFTNKKILIIGDLILDEYTFGKATRLSPEAPVPVVNVEKIVYVPGGAANAANNVRSLGSITYVVGLVGEDENGQKLIDLLGCRDIQTDGVYKDPERPTTFKNRVVCQGQHVVRFDLERTTFISGEMEDRLFNYIRKKIKRVDLVLISDYGKGVVSPTLCQKTINLAKSLNKKILVDPKGEDFGKYKGCFLIAPNLKELEIALKIKVRDLAKLPEIGEMLMGQVNSELVLVTCGENGMFLLEKSGKYHFLAAPDVKVIDISGAGDTALGTFALALASGANFYQAMLVASLACGVVIGKVGTAICTRDELKKPINSLDLKINKK